MMINQGDNHQEGVEDIKSGCIPEQRSLCMQESEQCWGRPAGRVPWGLLRGEDIVSPSC